MANLANLLATIAANVYTNHNNEVTAQMVKDAMGAIVSTMGQGGYIYKGKAVLSPTPTNPNSPDANVFYIATEPGTYNNFKDGGGNSIVVNAGEVAILRGTGTSWSKDVTGAATAAQLSALGQEVDDLETRVYGMRKTDSDTPYTSASKWVNSSGIIGIDTASILNRVSAISVTAGSAIRVVSDMSWAYADVGYFCDDSDNIVGTISKGSGEVTTYEGIVPTGATRLYVNFVVSFSVDGNGDIDDLSDRIDDLSDRIDGQCVILHSIAPDNYAANITAVGQVFFRTDTKKLRTCTSLSPLTFSDSDPEEKVRYLLGTTTFIWNGVDLVSNLTEQVVELYAISNSAPAGIQKGQYYYNTNTKKIAQNQGGSIYNTRLFNPSKNAVYVFGGSLYVWNGTDLVDLKIHRNTSGELPIISPAPQKPADGSQSADFNAETLTTAELYAAFDALLNSLQVPNSNTYRNPKFGTKYGKIGRDATNTFDINAYVFGKRNRFAWKASDALYAWANGGTIVYTESVSPLVGMTIYSDANRTDSGKTVSSFDSDNMQFVGSDSATYSRSSGNDVPADVVYSRETQGASTFTNKIIYTKSGSTIGTATPSGGDALVYGGKTYGRCEDFDYHDKHLGTIFLLGNEHGPQSDPAECAITLYRFAVDLCNGCHNNPFVSWLKENFMIAMIPLANPWGMDNHSRNNGNNININRNYCTPGWSNQADTDKGIYAGDQPETQFIMNTCLAFTPSVAMDLHCLSYITQANNGRTHYQGQTLATELLNKAIDTISGLSLSLTSYGGALPSTRAQGSDWITYQNIVGGLIEMNAGPYAASFDGKQHSSHIMTSAYTLFLDMLRVWIYEFDPTITLSEIHII